MTSRPEEIAGVVSEIFPPTKFIELGKISLEGGTPDDMDYTVGKITHHIVGIPSYFEGKSGIFHISDAQQLILDQGGWQRGERLPKVILPEND